ncbi:ankyrin repeat-containing protein [Toxoplasma gondii ME49]|uniref:Ankyrin repeat-containing protein n=1 Tax=Toxoplasma gondii (strain ATCC 50611 / Me49) TaxID=508771 RepID=S8GSM8_TOXGM|nr:ankyrin repeat-containing protein [Toxoplasma gondii ME49]EPT31604.1 ankyrin repeat-containing protein [Toxoplasma gondii ME49]|eukprot:XP_018638076.1 ankyrin repeat-containing protein [Toxoplasma gondii ME49]
MRQAASASQPPSTQCKRTRDHRQEGADRDGREETLEEAEEAAKRKRRKIVCGEGTPTPSKTRLYWNAVFEQTAESQYFVSSRRVRELVEDLLVGATGGLSHAPSQNRLEALVSFSVFGEAVSSSASAFSSSASAFASSASAFASSASAFASSASALAFFPPRARTASLVELMCGGRGNQIPFLSPISPLFRSYVGIDVSDRALSLSRCGSSSLPSSSSRSSCQSSSSLSVTRTAALERANKCRFLLQDCASLGDDLPLLKTNFALVVAGLDDLLVRNFTEVVEDTEGAEEVEAVLASAAAVLCVGGRLLALEPTRHLGDLLLAVTKALLSPSGTVRFLRLLRIKVVGSVAALLFRRESASFAADQNLDALRAFYRKQIRPLAALPALGLDAARLDVDDLRTRLPLLQHLARVQATVELSFLLLQACLSGNLEAAALLLARGADPNSCFPVEILHFLSSRTPSCFLHSSSQITSKASSTRTESITTISERPSLPSSSSSATSPLSVGSSSPSFVSSSAPLPSSPSQSPCGSSFLSSFSSSPSSPLFPPSSPWTSASSQGNCGQTGASGLRSPAASAPPQGGSVGGIRLLHLAAEREDLPFFLLLLQHGADPSLVNEDGLRAEDLLANAVRRELQRDRRCRSSSACRFPGPHAMDRTKQRKEANNPPKGRPGASARQAGTAGATDNAKYTHRASEKERAEEEEQRGGLSEENAGAGRRDATWRVASRLDFSLRDNGCSHGKSVNAETQAGWTSTSRCPRSARAPEKSQDARRMSARGEEREGDPCTSTFLSCVPETVLLPADKDEGIAERNMRSLALLSWLGVALQSEEMQREQCTENEDRKTHTEAEDASDETGVFLELLAQELEGPLVWPFVNPIEVIDACHRRLPPLENFNTPSR